MGQRLASMMVLLAAALGGGACSSGDKGFVDGAHMSGPTQPTPSAVPVDPCSVPQQGCPCDQPGEIAMCRGPLIKEGSYALCPTGYRSCVDGGWGSCILPSVQ